MPNLSTRKVPGGVLNETLEAAWNGYWWTPPTRNRAESTSGKFRGKDFSNNDGAHERVTRYSDIGSEFINWAV